MSKYHKETNWFHDGLARTGTHATNIRHLMASRSDPAEVRPLLLLVSQEILRGSTHPGATTRGRTNRRGKPLRQHQSPGRGTGPRYCIAPIAQDHEV